MKKLLNVLFLIVMVFSLSSCFAGMFEEEIKVNFIYEDEVISSDTLTQFKNIHTPALDEGYIYSGYRFYGWTPLNPDNVKATDENFKEEYIGDGKMVHYMDVKKYAKNGEVNLYALQIEKESIPHVYHYVVIAWYDKEATSGINANQMKALQAKLVEYLKAQGVSDEDIATIVVRGYTGSVGTSCANIMNDDDVDIMFGFGSKSNVVDTGGMKESSILETEALVVDYNGKTKNRTIHRLTENERVLKVMEWLKSNECKSMFHQEG